MTANNDEITENDILFNCPVCDKSLTIDKSAAGMMITCPDCKTEILVPSETDVSETIAMDPQEERIDELNSSLIQSQGTIQELIEELGATQKRRNYLEHLRVENLEHFETISRELLGIQAGIDRILSIIQDSERENA